MVFPIQLTRSTQQAVYAVAQAYGFQQLNPSPAGAGSHEEAWVGATAALASEQLCALLRDAISRRTAAHGAVQQQQQQEQQQPFSAHAAFVSDWHAAICDVHAEYFEEYARWTRKLCLPHPELQQQQYQADPRAEQAWRQQHQQQQRAQPQQQVLTRLLELSLQFCIYTEAANLRHTPHLLFLIYYVLRGSSTFLQVLSGLAALPPAQPQPGQQRQLPHSHWLHWTQLPADDFPAAAIPAAAGGGQQVLPGACDLSCLVRSLVQQLSDAVSAAFVMAPARRPSPAAAAAGSAATPCPAAVDAAAADDISRGPASSSSISQQQQEQQQQRQSSDVQAAAKQIVARVRASSGSQHAAWVEELLAPMLVPNWRQKQQTFLRLVVQPLFFFLAEQVDLAGQQAEEEPALRIAYCDVNEACCSPTAVYGLIKVLQQQYSGGSSNSIAAAGRGKPQRSSASASGGGGGGSSISTASQTGDLWQALQQVMAPQRRPPESPPSSPVWKRVFGGRKVELPENVKGRYPRDQKRLELLNKLDVLDVASSAAGSNSSSSGSAGAAQHPSTLTISRRAMLDQEATPLHEVYDVAKHGADWWAAHLFKHKTYVEARSMANPFVAFWRVYAFHAVLLTIMAALSYVWHERDVAAGVPWIRLVAALLLGTVTDALMRVTRAGAHLVLLSYRRPVQRKVGKLWKALDPFPPGTFAVAAAKVVLMLMWLVWTGALAFAVIPVLIGAPLSFYAPLDLWLQTRLLWLAPAGAHVVFVWGKALLCQRPGYTTSLFHELSARFSSRSNRQQQPQGLKAALAAATRTGARAYCAADPAIDALFYPASNLVIDRSRWLCNAGLWVVVFALKVGFELFLVVYPLVSLMATIVKGRTSYLSGALDLEQPEVSAVSHATTLVALAVPVILLSFSDTGLIFSLVGAALSVLEGFRKGVGSMQTWAQMVSRFEALLQCYREHCVSRTAMLLHLHSTDPLSVQEVSMSALAAGWNALVLDLRERDLLSNGELAALTFEQLQLTHSQKQHLRELPHVGQLGLTSVLPARCFMVGAVPELAAGAPGSAHHLWVGRVAFGWLLWVAWQAGLLYDDNDTQGPNRAVREREAIANLQHLANLKLLHPPRSREQIVRWQELLSETVALLRLLSASKTQPSNTADAAAAVLPAQGLTAAAVQARPEGLLHGVPQDDRKRREVWRALSSHVHRLLVLLDKELVGVEKLVDSTGPRSSSSGGSSGSGFMATLCGTRDADITPAEYRKAREALTGLRARWQQLASNASREAAPRQAQQLNMTPVSQKWKDDQELLRLQVLEHIATVGQASDGPGQVCRWLTDVLTMFAGDTVPTDEEAVRFVLSFASSLADPGLGVAPSIQAMPSLTSLVPHYSEDVLYALSEGDALADLSLAGDPSSSSSRQNISPASRSEMLYLLNDEGGSTPTLAYLRSVYNPPGQARSQWANFTERVKDLALAQGVTGLPKVVEEYHFLPGNVLHPLKHELLLWASWRGQLLARTVRGLMSYRAALQALAAHENPHLMPPEAQQQFDRLQESTHALRNRQEQLQQQLRALQAADRDSQAGGQESTQGQQLQQQQQHRRQEAERVAGKLAGVARRLQADAAQLEPLQQQHQQWEALRGVLLDDLVDGKYHLVVSSQMFGVFASKESSSNMKARWLVHSIHMLRQKHPTLKVAYIDKQLLASASVPGRKVELFRNASVLLASTQQEKLAAAAGLQQPCEAFRVLLPVNFESARGVVIGEGKPENQNHAVVFCPGEALQTIDCNQDNIVAEGLKLRNLLAELLPEGWDTEHLRARPTVSQAVRARFGPAGSCAATAAGAVDNAVLLQQIPQGKGRVALVGFREWIFSEDSGALAEFAAATERSFGTTVQRLMHNPGACRFHYGHPDVWRRSFVSTCGGVSKANKTLHVSEDVFGGYNVMLRGRDIKYVDYIAVGKGRDMGFETINTFEAKIAAGNGEQVLSRDVRRLAHNMDFTRLLSWYHTGNGFFINTALTMLSVQASLWAYLLLALDKSSNPEVQKYLSAVQVLQLGTLSVGVYLFTLTLEMGLLSSLFTIVRQVLQGSLMFYIFRAQTSAYSFTYDLLFGGAKYLPTGRGYKLAPTSFRDLYRRFGRSHFYFGAVLLQYGVACIAAGHLNGAELFVLWAQFLVVVSLLFGPFWFTPFAFRTTLVSEEFDRLHRWFMSPSPSPEHSWGAWNAESWWAASNAAGKQMGRLGSCLRAHLFKLPALVMVLAAVARMKAKDDAQLPKWAVALILAGGVLGTLSVIMLSRRVAARTALKSQVPRVLNLVATVLLAGGIAVSGWATSGQAYSNISSFSNVFLVFFGTVLLLRLLPLVYYSVLGRIEAFRDLTNATYYVADVLLVNLLNGLRFVLSLFDILTGLQAQLLFNSAYARQVMADTTLENSKLPELITEALVLKRKARATTVAQQ